MKSRAQHERVAEDEPLHVYDAKSLPPPQYTEPITKLYDRIVDLERRLEESMRATSPQYSPIDFMTPAECVITSRDVGFQPPEQAAAEQEPEEGTKLLSVQRIPTRRILLPLPTSSKLPPGIRSEHSLSSEL
jgi:hypothetical protein